MYLRHELAMTPSYSRYGGDLTFGSNFVDFFERVKVCHSNLCGREAHNRTISLMERINVKHPLSCNYRAFEAQVCYPRVPWPGKVASRTRESHVGELLGSATSLTEQQTKSVHLHKEETTY